MKRFPPMFIYINKLKMHGAFLYNGPSKKVEDLIKRPDVTLENVLDEDEALVELRSGNSALIQ